MIRFHDSSKPLLVPIDSVHQLPGNYRNGDIDQIMLSIRKNGFYGAVIADRNTGEILAGNHRYAALLGLGSDQIPVLWVDAPDYLTRMRIAVVDNRLSDIAKNDDAALALILADLADEERGLLGTGFSEDEYHRLLMDLEEATVVPESEGLGFALNGVYQVVIECQDKEEMEDILASCLDREWNARSVML